jgi:hypothetical protein
MLKITVVALEIPLNKLMPSLWQYYLNSQALYVLEQDEEFQV